MLQPLTQVLAAFLAVYMLILFIRVLLSWFQPKSLGKVYDIIYKITEPYLAIFRRIKFLNTGRFDFSVIAAILSLVIVENILLTLGTYGTITAGIILALLTRAVWSAASFIMFFYIAIIVIRLFSVLIGKNYNSPGWQSLDGLIQPLVFRFTRLLSPKKPLKYTSLLGIMAGIGIVVFFILRAIFRLLAALLAALPF